MVVAEIVDGQASMTVGLRDYIVLAFKGGTNRCMRRGAQTAVDFWRKIAARRIQKEPVGIKLRHAKYE